MAENNASHDQNERMEDRRSGGAVADGAISVSGSGRHGLGGIAALTGEAQAARALIDALNIRDDDELIETTIEGETGLIEAIDAALARIVELEALSAGVDGLISNLKTRQSRFDAGAGRLKGALMLAMDIAGLKKLERPMGTPVLAKKPDAVTITSEADLPSAYLVEKTTISPDMKAILAALKTGETVPGAHLSNGGVSLRINRK